MPEHEELVVEERLLVHERAEDGDVDAEDDERGGDDPGHDARKALEAERAARVVEGDEREKVTRRPQGHDVVAGVADPARELEVVVPPAELLDPAPDLLCRLTGFAVPRHGA